MRERFRERWGGVAGVLFLPLALLAMVGPAADPPRGAGGGGSDAGAPFLAAAQRGEVVPPGLEAVERMCALMVSCSDLPFPASATPPSIAACVKLFADELARPGALELPLTLRECGLRAHACIELSACALRGASADACLGRGHAGAAGLCDTDGRALTCLRDRVIGVRDCPRGGEHCAVRDGQATCALGPCAGSKDGETASCSASGTRVLACEKGKLVGVDCAALGLRCVAGGSGAACAPSTSECSGDARRCEGSVAVACYHGREVRIDCGAAGLACGGPGSALGACTVPPAGESCDPAQPARCEGGLVRYCAAGRPRTFACRAIGLARCVSDAKGARCAS